MVLTKFARLTLCSLSIAGVLALSFATNSQAGAQAQQQQPPKKETKPVIARPTGEEAIEPNQPIKTDFLLAISVVGEAEPSIDYVVDASGNIQVKYVGIQIPVSVRGLLPAQAADAVAKALKTYIKSPQVTVSIVSIPRPIAFINGAVLNPGPLSIKAETTLIDVLQIAAYREDADLSQVRITRTEKVDGVEKQSIIVAHFDKYIKIIEGQAPSEKDNPIIKDKDRILVLSKVSSLGGTVSVQGEVSKPAIGIAIRTNPPMTVREVINLAGQRSEA